MTTDFHTHIFHPSVAAKAVGRLAGMGFSPVGEGVLDDLLVRCARAGISRVVCHSAALTAGQVRPANNFVLSLAAGNHSQTGVTVVPFGAVHPDYTRWPEELDRLEASGIKGLKLHPNLQDLAFDDPRLFPVMEAIGGRFVVMCHAGCEPPLADNPASPYKLAKLAALFPQVRFIAAHLGGYADGGVALDALAGKDVWLDTSNTAAMDPVVARTILRVHSRDRVLFGSDYPLFDPGREVERQKKALGLTAPDLDRLERNANALLGAPAPAKDADA